MKKIKEKDAQTEFNSRVKKAGGFIHKISDMSLGAKPMDCFGVVNGKILYNEMKIVRGKRSLLFSQLRENQIASLLKIYNNTPLEMQDSVLSGFGIAMINDEEKVERIVWVPIMEVISQIEDGEKKLCHESLKMMDDLYDLLEI